ncbi:MAG: hypothetical protein ACI4UX_01385 [Clostridia bacterium]
MDEKVLQMATEALQQAKSAHHRIDRMEKLLDEIRADVKSTNSIAISVEKIATEMKEMRVDVNKVDERLTIIEQKPMKEYEESRKDVKKQVRSFIIGIILAFLAFKLGLNKFI